jgi:hypothetical protein
MFVKVFFQKACHEEKYTNLYIDLIKFIASEITKFENNGSLPAGKYNLLKIDFVERI